MFLNNTSAAKIALHYQERERGKQETLAARTTADLEADTGQNSEENAQFSDVTGDNKVRRGSKNNPSERRA